MTVSELDRLAGVVATVLEIPRPAAATAAVDTVASWDSLAHLNLLMAIEQEFAVSFEADEVPELDSVPRIATAIDRQREASS